MMHMGMFEGGKPSGITVMDHVRLSESELVVECLYSLLRVFPRSNYHEDLILNMARNDN